jgi:hypothetical protein
LQTVADLAPRALLVEQFVLERDQERDTLNRVPAWLDDIERTPRRPPSISST